MACVLQRLFGISAGPVALALAASWAAPAGAQSSLRLFTPDAFEVTGDVRIAAATGERSWLDGGFGKLRSSGCGADVRVRPELGNLNLVWKPQLGWSIGAIVVGSVQGGERTEAGLSQAYLTFHPMRTSRLAFSFRAGLMFPPVSLEHEGADWQVKDSITPSTINSWIGEEVRPVAAEGSLAADLGDNKLRASAAIMAANDTSGTLLTFRGWALHDRTTLAFHAQPLPPFDGEIAEYQARFTHPLLDLHDGFAHRPGYYAKLSWQPPVPVRIELFRYDNRADPQQVNSDFEWGWRTAFDDVGIVSDLGGGTELRVQAMEGRTQMGHVEDGRRWVDDRFRSAFAMLFHPFGPFGLAVRGEAFDTHNRGSLVGDEYDDKGWSAMIAAKHQWGRLTGLVELLHVSSRREDRGDVGLAPRQDQTQLQAEVRTHW